jgi:uncharacterized protein (DUF2236 family)
LVDSTIVAYDAWLGPVARDRAARFYEETKPIARAFGVPESMLPPDLDGFERYLASMLAPDGPIAVSATARELAGAILAPPLPGVLGRVPLDPRLYGWTLWPAVGLLPADVRAAFGLPWGPRERGVASWLVFAWRAWRPLLPATFRQMPQALAAHRRVAR